jgi:hypothetical protein
MPAVNIPIDSDFTIGSLTGHVNSASGMGTVWDSFGNTMPVSYDATQNQYVMKPPAHTDIVFIPRLPPGYGIPSLHCIADIIGALIYLGMIHAELDAFTDYVCTNYGPEDCIWAYGVAEQINEYYENYVDNWLQQQGCGGLQ